ncbi:MAG: hypothetical protein Q9190_007079, partial [Brigantiaea leucoxantha]
MKKQEEKRRKQAAEKDAREKESKLAAHRAEIEAAKDRERQLQLQLESLGDESSSDEEGPQDITPQETTPTSSQVLSRDKSPPVAEPPVAPVPAPNEFTAASLPVTSNREPSSSVSSGNNLAGGRREPSSSVSSGNNIPSGRAPSSSVSSESKNPFFKKLSQANETAATPPTAQSASSITSPAEVSTNPFHRLTQQQEKEKESSKSQPFPPLTSTPTGSRPSRHRPEEDEWSVVDSTEDSSSDVEGEDRPTGGSAKQLASILFGTMAPPRPLSATDDKPKSPALGSPSTP